MSESEYIIWASEDWNAIYSTWDVKVVKKNVLYKPVLCVCVFVSVVWMQQIIFWVFAEYAV